MVSLQSWVGLVDGIAVKPTVMDVSSVDDIGVETIVVDFEGMDSMPSNDTLAELAESTAVRVTVPVRGTGFDPLGDDSRCRALPPAVDRVLVAGHPAYLSSAERQRAAGPRVIAAADSYPDAWVGTEGIERIALATGLTQFELLAKSTERTVMALRGGRVETSIAVYAPIVPSADADRILDAIGEYVARRPRVSRGLPDDAVTDSSATGRTRDRLLTAAEDVALVGSSDAIQQRVDQLRSVGVDTIIAYPALGVESLRSGGDP